jgi:hypothetical protein
VAAPQTRPGEADVGTFLDAVPDPVRQADARAVCALMGELTGEPPAMWGPSIVGFGRQHLVYDSGRELDWMLVGFSPRKAALTIYLTEGFEEHRDLMARLGKHSTGASCLYVKKLADVDTGVLAELVTRSVTRAQS